jgi:hypothetical protein
LEILVAHWLAFPARGFLSEGSELANRCRLVGQWQDSPVEATQRIVFLETIYEHIEERSVFGPSVFRDALSLAEGGSASPRSVMVVFSPHISATVAGRPVVIDLRSA